MITIGGHNNTYIFYLLAKVTLEIRQFGEFREDIRQLANTVIRKKKFYWRKSH